MNNWRKSTLKSLLEGCSWQWALENVYNFKGGSSPHAALGTGFHKAMEMYEVNGREDTLESLQSIAAETSFQICKDSISMEQWFMHELDPQWVVDGAREAVRLWWEQPLVKKEKTLKDIADSRTFINSEIYLETDVSWSQRGLQGTIDAVYRDDTHYILVDYKTASSFRKWGYEQGVTIEASVYLAMFALQPRDIDLPVKFEWHVVSPKEGKVRVVEGGEFGPHTVELLQDKMNQANVLYDLGAYRPRPDWNLCQEKWCAYWTDCRVNGTLSPYSLTTSNVPDGSGAPTAPSGLDG